MLSSAIGCFCSYLLLTWLQGCVCRLLGQWQHVDEGYSNSNIYNLKAARSQVPYPGVFLIPIFVFFPLISMVNLSSSLFVDMVLHEQCLRQCHQKWSVCLHDLSLLMTLDDSLTFSVPECIYQPDCRMTSNLCFENFWQLIQGWSSCRAHLNFKIDTVCCLSVYSFYF